MHMPRRWLLALLVLTAVALPGPGAWVRSTTRSLVSRADGPAGAAADGNSMPGSRSRAAAAMSRSSRRRTTSPAEDDDTVTNVYLRDTETGVTRAGQPRDGVAGAGADGNSSNPSVSPPASMSPSSPTRTTCPTRTTTRSRTSTSATWRGHHHARQHGRCGAGRRQLVQPLDIRERGVRRLRLAGDQPARRTTTRSRTCSCATG